MSADTIAAIVTPYGRAAVGIIRISGPLVKPISKELLGDLPPPRHASYRHFMIRQAQNNSHIIDSGIAIFFPAPHSYTGEDVLELQGHGNSILQRNLLQEIFRRGGRQAQPGEFSKRAFLNQRIDLTQAEAVAALIASNSTKSAQAALRSMHGNFSRCVNEIVSLVDNLRASVEAGIDFADEEDVPVVSPDKLRDEFLKIQGKIDTLLIQAARGAQLNEGFTLAIIGPPNSGKSTLFNQLVGNDASIVHNQPGTTRDRIREQIRLGEREIRITDTAGLHAHSDDMVEQKGMDLTRSEIAQSDHLIVVVTDDNHSAVQDILPLVPLQLMPHLTVVYNKADLTGAPIEYIPPPPYARIRICAHNGNGIPLLMDQLEKQMDSIKDNGSPFWARQRHITALQAAQEICQKHDLCATAEITAELLHQCSDQLSEITSTAERDELLDKIFSQFCIGK